MSLDGARCEGRWDLFDSVDLRDHEVARDLCASCPALRDCAVLLHEIQVASRVLATSGGGPHGTWAGKLVGASARGRRGRAFPTEHGTERGYQQHRHRGEKACADCRAAHSAASRKVAS